MALTSGTKLGPYEVIAPLGAGGMGEVYRARDTKLGRDVALKVLPAAFAQDAERMARFQREAQVLASLNHTNIAAIYGLEESGGVRALVMELVEGPTLAKRLGSGAIPLDDALPIAKQIAEALEYAHEKGIIHRDLKPANIKQTGDNQVEVLDFGLAKALDVDASVSSSVSNSPTLTAAATQAGVILGTAAYMSPEQAKGKHADRRADIWGFGCVLFEMLTGQRAFEGESATDTLAAVIKSEPNWDALPRDIPANIRRLLERCLNKDPKHRLQAIGEARIAIEDFLADTGDLGATLGSSWAGQAPPLEVRWRRVSVAWGVVATVTALTLALLLLLRKASHAERMQFAMPVQSEVSHLALSADGRTLAFVARDDASGENMLYIQRIGSADVLMLPGSESAYYPFWSPDGGYIAFFSSGKLKKVAVAGGPSQVIAEATSGRGGAWGKRGVIIYAPDAGGPLWRVNADGTNPAPLTAKLDVTAEDTHRWPVFLPDGDRFLFWAGTFASTTENRSNGIYVSSLAALEKKLLITARSNAAYSNGQLLYVDDRRELIAVSVDAPHAKVTGAPRVLAEGLAYQPSIYWGAFTAGGNGTVVYNTSAAAALSVLTWYDRTGKELGRVGEPGILANPAISPDGSRAAVDIADLKANNVDIWIDDLKPETSSRFTFDPAEEVSGVWSRDGSMLAYRLNVAGGAALEIKRAMGVEPNRTVFTASSQDDLVPNSWTPDDKQILCTLQPAAGGSDLVLIDVSRGKKVLFLAGKASETNGQISPDGKWVAYASNETGDWEVYVTTFPNPVGKWQVSRGGGTEPRWRGDGKEIFYIGAKGTLTAAEVSTEGTFSTGAPSLLFQAGGRAPISSTDLFTYDVARDGKRFLVNRSVKPEHVQPLTVVLNATTETKQ